MITVPDYIADHLRRTDAIRAAERGGDAERDPFCSSCGYCHGTGRTREHSQYSGATVYATCHACGGLGSKEGSAIAGATT